MMLRGMNHRPGQYRHPVLVSFAFVDGDLAPLEIQILQPQPERLEESQSTAIEQRRDQPLVACAHSTPLICGTCTILRKSPSCFRTSAKLSYSTGFTM